MAGLLIPSADKIIDSDARNVAAVDMKVIVRRDICLISRSLDGDGGLDQIIGGAGADTVTGGAGADVFTFRPSDFLAPNVPTLSERITGFAVAEDRIDLSSIDGAGSGDTALVFRGTAGINGAGQVAIRTPNGNTVVDISFTLATVEATMLIDGIHAMTSSQFFP